VIDLRADAVEVPGATDLPAPPTESAESAESTETA